MVDTDWIKVRKDSVKLPSGHIIDDYYVVEKNDVALVVALDEDNRVILKSEYRYPIDSMLIEIPGGVIEEDGDPLEAAKRELLEETGYNSDQWEYLGVFYDHPTRDINNLHLFLAKNVSKVSEQSLDEAEDISFSFTPIAKAVQMVMDNEIKVSGSAIAILKVFHLMSKQNMLTKPTKPAAPDYPGAPLTKPAAPDYPDRQE